MKIVIMSSSAKAMPLISCFTLRARFEHKQHRMVTYLQVNYRFDKPIYLIGFLSSGIR